MNEIMNHSEKAEKKDNYLMNMLTNFYAKIINSEDSLSEGDRMIHSIKHAHEEWRNAEAFFQDVTDPDLVDYAIYRVEAAKTRYAYLMKVARKMGIKTDFH